MEEVSSEKLSNPPQRFVLICLWSPPLTPRKDYVLEGSAAFRNSLIPSQVSQGWYHISWDTL